MNTNRLLVHPVRARILSCLAGRRLSTQDLAELIPEVPLPTLYRNLKILVDAGLIATVEKIQRRGVVQHVYEAVGKTSVTKGEAAEWGPTGWQQGLDSFLGGISATYRAYLSAGGNEPCPAWGGALYVTPEEEQELGEAIRAAVQKYADRRPSDGRRRLVVSVVVQPDQDPPPKAD
jgi:DNA-binding transcriptional ArsR family regulator